MYIYMQHFSTHTWCRDIYVYIYIYTNICTYMYICNIPPVSHELVIFIHKYTYTHTYTSLYIHIHMYIHIYIYTYT